MLAALAQGLLPCPATRWSPATGASPATAERTILRPVHAPASAAGAPEAELAWLRENADDLMALLSEAGALPLSKPSPVWTASAGSQRLVGRGWSKLGAA
eukprot:scaffold45562_cov63-Phaeocystis_antarctica.AAC.2